MTNLVATNAQPELTMTSIEIAGVTGKRHDNVLRDIRTMLKEIGLGLLKFEGTYLDKSNRESQCYHLPKNLVMTLMAKYEFKVGYTMTQHIEKLEAQLLSSSPMAIAQTMNSDQLGLLLDVKRQQEETQKQVELREVELQKKNREIELMELTAKEREAVNAANSAFHELLMAGKVFGQANYRFAHQANMTSTELSHKIEPTISKGKRKCSAQAVNEAAVRLGLLVRLEGNRGYEATEALGYHGLGKTINGTVRWSFVAQTHTPLIDEVINYINK